MCRLWLDDALKLTVKSRVNVSSLTWRCSQGLTCHDDNLSEGSTLWEIDSATNNSQSRLVTKTININLFLRITIKYIQINQKPLRFSITKIISTLCYLPSLTCPLCNFSPTNSHALHVRKKYRSACAICYLHLSDVI